MPEFSKKIWSPKLYKNLSSMRAHLHNDLKLLDELLPKFKRKLQGVYINDKDTHYSLKLDKENLDQCFAWDGIPADHKKVLRYLINMLDNYERNVKE